MAFCAWRHNPREQLFPGFEFFEEGPLPAVEEFVKRNRDFVIDSTRERYIATYNPKGFLKRIQ